MSQTSYLILYIILAIVYGFSVQLAHVQIHFFLLQGRVPEPDAVFDPTSGGGPTTPRSFSKAKRTSRQVQGLALISSKTSLYNLFYSFSSILFFWVGGKSTHPYRRGGDKHATKSKSKAPPPPPTWNLDKPERWSVSQYSLLNLLIMSAGKNFLRKLFCGTVFINDRTFTQKRKS